MNHNFGFYASRRTPFNPADCTDVILKGSKWVAVIYRKNGTVAASSPECDTFAQATYHLAAVRSGNIPPGWYL